MTNKLVIPAILAATVLVAGMFAFMPVQKASTVHTTITNTLPQLKTQTNTLAVATASTTVTVTIDRNAPFQLVAFTAECTQGAGAVNCFTGESIDPATVRRDGESLAATIAAAAVAGAAGPGTSIAAINQDAVSGATDVNYAELGVADRIVITVTVDADDVLAADDGFTITIRATILETGNTAFAAADIGLAQA